MGVNKTLNQEAHISLSSSVVAPKIQTLFHLRSADMKLKITDGMFWKFFITVIVAMLHEVTSAGAPLPTLTCNVSRQADGFRYRLSRPPRSPECGTGWETQNKTAIAQDSDFDKKQAWNVTNQSLTTKDCHHYLRYTRNCLEGWEEAECKINCSRILDLKHNLTTTVDSTLICFTEGWCLTQFEFGLWVTVIAIVVVGVIVALLCFRKCRRRTFATRGGSYTPANTKNNMELEEMEGVTVKT